MRVSFFLTFFIIFISQSPARGLVSSSKKKSQKEIFLAEPGKPLPRWVTKLQSRVMSLAKNFRGEFGLYVKDLSSGDVYSMNAHSPWYIASAIKFPVALELFRQVEAGEVSLSEEIEIVKSDYRDGAGLTNWLAPRSKVTIRFLLRQMLVESDNSAADLIIRRITLEKVNQMVQRSVPRGFWPIITLLDVRRRAYAELHPDAMEISNMDFFTLKKIRGDRLKLKKFAGLIKIEPRLFRVNTIKDAFERFYEKGYNTATLVACGELLERFIRGELLPPSATKELLSIMLKCKTGRERIVAGLGSEIEFSHKTGTQKQRLCDMGIASARGGEKSKILVITACASGFRERQSANRLFKNLGRAIRVSGVFKEGKPETIVCGDRLKVPLSIKFTPSKIK